MMATNSKCPAKLEARELDEFLTCATGRRKSPGLKLKRKRRRSRDAIPSWNSMTMNRGWIRFASHGTD